MSEGSRIQVSVVDSTGDVAARVLLQFPRGEVLVYGGYGSARTAPTAPLSEATADTRGSSLLEYLAHKETILASRFLVVHVGGMEDLSFALSAVRKMIAGDGPASLYIVSALDLDGLFRAACNAEERELLSSMMRAKRIVISEQLSLEDFSPRSSQR